MARFIDLFAGIGGFHVALQQEGLKCVFACEIDAKASDAYFKNFGLNPVGDICEIAEKDIPEHEVLCAGFPCQPFSLSGKLNAFRDDRGKLFYQIVRIAKFHKPKLLLLENVKNILTIDGGEAKKEIYRELEKIGYKVDHRVLNAGDFGIPQKRERTYFVAARNDSNLKFNTPTPSFEKKYVKDILVSEQKTKDLVIDRNDIQFDNSKSQPLSERPIRIGFLNKGGQGERIYSVNGHAITLSANGGGVGNRTGLYYVNKKVRRLHIDEAKQVMGFSKSHIVSNGISGYRQLGNAVIPQMIRQVYRNIDNTG